MSTPEGKLEYLRALRLRKARALALYLMMEPGRERRSELIIDLLWQDAEPDKAGASLRQTVRQLRVAAQGNLSFPVITRNGCIFVDYPRDWSLFGPLLAEFHQNDTLSHAASTAESLAECFDALLGISSNFDSWLEITKNRVLTEIQQTLERVMGVVDADHALAAALWMTRVDPYHEGAARLQMMSAWRTGSATKAISLYDRLYKALDETFDQEPEAASVELLAAIKLDPEGGASLAVNHRPRPQKVTLVVENPGEAGLDARDKSFQSVLISDLRSRLGRFREWQVIPERPVDDDFLTIHGRLLPLDDRYRLVVEVVHTQNRELIWSELIEDPQTDWIGKVRLLILNIGNALRVVVADRQGRDTRAELYDRWLQSLALKGTWSQADEDRAVALLRGITQEAPDFGPAHAELAGIYNIRHILRPGTRQEPGLQDKALTHALDAVVADAMDTRAHRVLAWCYCHKGEFDLAEFHFEQSLQLNPQNVQTLASAVLGFAFCANIERTQSTLAELERLPEALEPFHDIYLAAARYLLGDYAASAAHCRGGTGLMSTVGGWHSAAMAKLGQGSEARARLRQYHAEISAIWCGPQAPSLREVIYWYVDCFPLRSEAVREDLRMTLLNIAALPAAESVTHVGNIDPHSAVEG